MSAALSNQELTVQCDTVVSRLFLNETASVSTYEYENKSAIKLLRGGPGSLVIAPGNEFESC